jgi:hypothetical protein
VEDDDREEGEVNPPPHSSLREAIPLLGDIFSRQAWITVGAHRPKWTQSETGPSIGSPPQPCLTFVSPDL